MPGHRATLEGLDNDHTAAAVWAGMRIIAIGGIGRFGLVLWDGEHLAGARDVVGAGGFGQQAVMADAVESVWQHMDQETADELVGCERHHLVSIAAFDPVVLPLESNGLVVECDQAAVGDGDAVGVAREIGQHCLGSAEGTLRIDDPFGFVQRRQICREDQCIGERSVVAEELKLFVGCGEGPSFISRTVARRLYS